MSSPDIFAGTAVSSKPVVRRRLLWLSHLLPWPPKGGLLQRSYYLLREVSKYHDVRVLAFHQYAHHKDAAALHAAIQAISQFATVSYVSTLPEDRWTGGRAILAARALLPGPPYTILWGTCRYFRQAVSKQLREFDPDIIHFDTISLAPYLSEIGGKRAVLNHHNIESAMLLRRAAQERNRFKSRYFRQEGKRLARYERQVAPRFSRHIVCAELDAQRLTATVGQASTSVIPNGVDVSYFRPAAADTQQDSDSLVFVGGLTWYPNVSGIRFFLKEVWPIVSAARPQCQLRIIGRHPPADLCRAARSDQRIQLFGFVDDIRPTVERSMVYICPIFDGGGTKLKMLDAMAMGKAIVAHPVAAEGLGVTDGKEILVAESPRVFADRILALFDNQTMRRSLELSARKTVIERFDVTAIGKQLAALLGNAPNDLPPST